MGLTAHFGLRLTQFAPQSQHPGVKLLQPPPNPAESSGPRQKALVSAPRPLQLGEHHPGGVSTHQMDLLRWKKAALDRWGEVEGLQAGPCRATAALPKSCSFPSNLKGAGSLISGVIWGPLIAAGWQWVAAACILPCTPLTGRQGSSSQPFPKPCTHQGKRKSPAPRGTGPVPHPRDVPVAQGHPVCPWQGAELPPE